MYDVLPARFRISQVLSPGQTRMRVAESSDSRSRLASNSHALSATFIDSRLLSSNFTMLKFFRESRREFSVVWPKR